MSNKRIGCSDRVSPEMKEMLDFASKAQGTAHQRNVMIADRFEIGHGKAKQIRYRSDLGEFQYNRKKSARQKDWRARKEAAKLGVDPRSMTTQQRFEEAKKLAGYGRLTVRSAAIRLGCCNSQAWKLINMARMNQEDRDAANQRHSEYMRKWKSNKCGVIRSKVDADVREAALDDLLRGKSLTLASEHSGIPRTTLTSWVCRMPLVWRDSRKVAVRAARAARDSARHAARSVKIAEQVKPSATLPEVVDAIYADLGRREGRSNPDRDDILQEAYLCILEGQDREQAMKSGRRAANVHNVRFQRSMQDVLRDEAFTLGDVIEDETALDAFDDVLERIDRERAEYGRTRPLRRAA